MKRQNSTRILSSGRKKTIIEAALGLFSGKGYTETSMSDICKKAGASTGSVYHHFKSKEQLAAAVYLEGIGEYQKGLLDAIHGITEARTGIWKIVRFHLTWVEKHTLWARFLFQQRHAHFMNNTDDDIDNLNKNFVAGVARWFGEQIQQQAIRPLAPDLIIAVLLGPCQEFSRLFLEGKAVSSIEKSIDVLAESAWQSLSFHNDGS